MCRIKTAYNYLAGVIIGDGTLYRQGNTHYIYIYDKNYEYLKELKTMIQKVFKTNAHIYRKNKNYYRLQVVSKSLYEEIQKRIKIRQKKPVKSFVAGLTDAEGTIYIDKKCRIVLEIANTNKELIYSIMRYIKKKGINATVTKHRGKGNRKTIYKVRIRGWENIEKFIQIFNPIHPKIVEKYDFLKSLCKPG